MARILLTAFEPYGPWIDNASWLTLIRVTHDLPSTPEVVTRKYPVDFDEVQERIAADLLTGFDFALHLGQAPGTTAIQLESTAINVRQDESMTELGTDFGLLQAGGEAAFQTNLPIAEWANGMRQQGLPVQVSHYAGTYLCNALYYWSLSLSREAGGGCRSLFVHLPVASEQAEAISTPSLSADVSASVIRNLLTYMHALADEPELA
ncbi:MAG: hypothetical protein KDA60_14075 [Planctomycetales bacterium]|nr:hypothetical protein [Planctomycetales bacterium]